MSVLCFISCRWKVLLGFCLFAAAATTPGRAALTAPGTDVSTGDQLTLTLADDGSLDKLKLDAKEIPLQSPGGFFLQDMSREAVPKDIPVQGRPYPGIPLKGGTMDKEADGTLRHRMDSAASGVSFEARYIPHEGYLEIQTKLRNLSSSDRALTLYFRLPFDAAGWKWAHALGDEAEIKAGTRYYDPNWFYRGSRPSLSGGHIGSLSGKPGGLSMAIRADDPRLFRMVYEQPYGFSIEFELGLSARTLNFPNEATARFLLYRHDPSWGLRSAFGRYMGFFPAWYARSPKAPDGLWVTSVSKDLADPEDFGIVYWETYDWSRSSSRQHGILHMKYTEPWCDHIFGDWDLIKAHSDPAAKGSDKGLAKGQPGFVQCRAALASAVLDRDGKPQAFWSKLRGGDPNMSDGEGYGPDLNRYATNPALDVPVPVPGLQDAGANKIWAEDWLAGKAGAPMEQMSNLVRKDPSIPWVNRGKSVYGWELYKQWGRDPDPSKPDNRYEGLYYDSTAGWWSGWHFYNFNPDHVATARIPAVFDHQSRRVALYHGFSCVEFMRECSRKMAEEGRVTMANAGPGFDLFYVAPYLDMVGAGENYDASGGLGPLRQLRLAVGPKPLSYLNNPKLDEKIFEKCLLFGVFPGGFKLEKRDLFRKYVPALKALGGAGWQPIPYARADKPEVVIERFGSGDGVHFATHSLEKGSPAPGPVKISVEADKAGLLAPSGIPLLAVDLVSGQILPLERDASVLRFSFDLSPGQTRVFALRRK